MRARALLILLTAILTALIIGGLLYTHNLTKIARQTSQQLAVAITQSPSPSASPGIAPSSMPSTLASPAPVDLSVDTSGLSKTTVVIRTERGVIKFKLYPQDAPLTVHRIVELIQNGFYNGLTFHRVEPNFVIQGGDPVGNGRGGSGQNIKAEFNNRHHIEGTVAMARAQDPNSADSQFYITLSPQPRLDHSYTVFGQVIEGMDAARKIQVGDKMLSVTLE